MLAETIIGCGVSYVPEDRQGMGLVLSASILDNLLLKAYRLPPVARGPFLNYTQAATEARRLLSAFAMNVSRLNTQVRAFGRSATTPAVGPRACHIPPCW